MFKCKIFLPLKFDGTKDGRVCGPWSLDLPVMALELYHIKNRKHKYE